MIFCITDAICISMSSAQFYLMQKEKQWQLRHWVDNDDDDDDYGETITMVTTGMAMVRTYMCVCV